MYSWGKKEVSKGEKGVEKLEDVMGLGIDMILEIDGISSILKNLKVIWERIEDKSWEYIKGLKEMSGNLDSDEKNILFEIVYVLNVGRNSVKNGRWKE